MVSTRTRVGLVLAAVLALADVVSVFFPTPDGAVGPPFEILLLAGALGVATLVAVALAWRTGRRAALWVVAGTRVLSALTALPAFFVEVPVWLKLLVALVLVLTAVSVVLVLAPARRSVPASDLD